MADDIEIDLAKMSLWSKGPFARRVLNEGASGRTEGVRGLDCGVCARTRADEATEYFESGGQVEPVPAGAAVEPAAKMARPSDATIKQWFPKWKPVEKPKFRLVCFHNAGSSESVYTGKGLRQTEENPFVTHCASKGGELMACELPGREARRNEARETKLRPYCEALYPVLAPLLQEDVPYVIVGHSMCAPDSRTHAQAQAHVACCMCM